MLIYLRRFSFILFTVLGLSACTTSSVVHLYDGPALAKDVSTRITLPLDLEVIELDGRVISQGKQRFRSDAMTLVLPPGPHQLIVVYETLWDLDGDNHEVIRSQPMLFEFEARNGEQWSFDYKRPARIQQARTFAENSRIHLVSRTQKVSGFPLKAPDPLTFNEKKEVEPQAFPYLQQLQYWWQQATPYERKQFKEWINQPEKP